MEQRDKEENVEQRDKEESVEQGDKEENVEQGDCLVDTSVSLSCVLSLSLTW